LLPEKKGIDQGFEVISVGKKIVEVVQRKASIGGCESVIKQADQRINQKYAEKGPDRPISQPAAELHLGPETNLR